MRYRLAAAAVSATCLLTPSTAFGVDDATLRAQAEATMRAHPTFVIETGVAFPVPTREITGLLGTVMDDPMYLAGSDYLVGITGGFDVFASADPSDPQPGQGLAAWDGGYDEGRKYVPRTFPPGPDGDEGPKGDLFVLGDAERAYYANRASAADDDDDFVYITRFEKRAAIIRLHGAPEDYRVVGARGGSALFYRHDGVDDLIAHIARVQPWELNLRSEFFEYATPPATSPAVPGGVDQLGGRGINGLGYTDADADGNVYMMLACNSKEPLAATNGEVGSFCVVKYDRDGNRVWARAYGELYGELPWRLVVDGDHVYALGMTVSGYAGTVPVGQSLRKGGVGVAYVTKISAATGDQIAAKFLIPPDTPNPSGIPLATLWSATKDNAGNLIVGGGTTYAHGFPPGAAPWIMKLRMSDLSIQWWDIPRDGKGEIIAAETIGGISFVPDGSGVPGRGSIYAGGYSTFGGFLGASPGSTDSWTVKYTADGQLQWGRAYGMPLRADHPWQTEHDSKGNIYQVGVTYGRLDGQRYSGQGDGYVRKMTPNGDRVWTRLIGTPRSDYVHAIKIVDDVLYIGGDTMGDLGAKNTGRYHDVWAARMSTDGRLLGPIRQYGTPGMESMFTLTVTDRNVWLGGHTEGSLVTQGSGQLSSFLLRLDRTSLDVDPPAGRRP
ncbi:hypothetical protein LRS13_13590 [Svornostia abyssi]|uniref:Uncharacterized protein n=1 Tax=Svornostia abyssi TaxID=2898438 RepID=A0ABY5PAS6_9ACTN|nr:hypothetical protein LRS13_13590 [Parviterribacteraceae bacterium J379]